MPILQNIREVHLNIHDGLDGSGGHTIFNQKGSEDTNNIIMYMFRMENIQSGDKQLIWTNPTHASSSCCRPVMLLMRKETIENCKIISELQKERQDCYNSVTHFGNTIDVKVNAMVDGKLHSLFTGLGGAFCCLCTYGEKQCNDVDYINAGFKTDMPLEQICGDANLWR